MNCGNVSLRTDVRIGPRCVAVLSGRHLLAQDEEIDSICKLGQVICVELLSYEVAILELTVGIVPKREIFIMDSENRAACESEYTPQAVQI